MLSCVSSNVFLLTGDNTYLLWREVSRWQQRFREKCGEHADVSIVEADTCTRQQLLDEISSAPFLSEKRLTLIMGLPAFDKEDLLHLLSHIHPQTILTFVAASPDRRSSLVRSLLKEATVRDFPLPTSSELRQWVAEEGRQLGLTIAPETLTALLQTVGRNQWHLHWELRKLRSLGTAPTPDQVRCVCPPVGEQTIWRLIHLLAEGSARTTLAEIRGLLVQGESPMKLWNMVLWAARQALGLAIADGTGTPRDRAVKDLSIPRASLPALSRLARRFQSRGLLSVSARLLRRDEAVKTGKLRASDEHPEEIVAVLEREILAL